MKKSYPLILLFWVICYCQILIAQSSLNAVMSRTHTVNFTIADGLPSNNVYDLEQDSLDRIWICTDAGIAVYDGHTFEKVDQGNHSKVVTQVEIDAMGKLWFADVKGEIFYWENGYHQVRIPEDSLWENGKSEPLGYFSLSKEYLVRQYTSGHSVVYRYDEPKLTTEKIFSAQKGSINLVRYGGINFVSVAPDATNGYTEVNVWRNDSLQHRYSIDPIRLNAKSIKLEEIDAAFLIQLDQKLLRVEKENHQISWIPAHARLLSSLAVDGSQQVWIGTHLDGAIQLDGDSLKHRKHELEGYSVSSFLHGESDKFWMGTLGKGIVLINSHKVQLFPQSMIKGKITKMHNSGNRLVVGTNDGAIYSIEEGKNSYQLNLIHKVPNGSTVNQIFSSNEKLIVRAGTTYLKLHLKPLVSVQELAPQEAKRQLKSFNWKSTAINGKAPNIDIRVDHIRRSFEFEETGVYYGHFRKSFFYDQGLDRHRALFPDSAVDLRSAIRYMGDTFLLGTQNEGLLLTHKEKVLHQIDLGKITGSPIQHLARNPYGIFASTGRELISIESVQNGHANINLWNARAGFDQTTINGLSSWGEALAVATSDGLFIFNPGLLGAQSVQPKIHTLSLNDGSVDYENQKQPVSIAASSSHLTISTSAVGYSSQKGLEFRYRILPVDSGWAIGSENFVIPTHLAPGDYTLEAAVRNKGLMWSEPQKMKIQVVAPFWEEHSSLKHLFALIIGGILVFIYFRYGTFLTTVIVTSVRRTSTLMWKWLGQKIAFNQASIPSEESELIRIRKEPNKMAVPTKQGLRILLLDQVTFLKSDSNYTTINVANGKSLLVSKTLKRFEESLAKTSLVRVNRQFIVNMLHVKEYTFNDGGWLILRDGLEIPVGKSYRERIERQMESAIITI